MNFFPNVKSCRQMLAMLCFVLPVFGYAQTTTSNHTFSYTILEVEPSNVEQFETVRGKVLSETNSNGGTPYATWTFASKPEGTPFAGLAENQLGLMIAWPSDGISQLNTLNVALEADSSLTIISSRLFEPIYLPSGLEVPTGRGFYVHREEEYRLKDVESAFRLSREAWVTWEPHWGVKVVGLFREIGDTSEIVNLNRIAWYPSYDAWLATRNFLEDMESAVRFRERRTLLVPGSGIAIATDRMLP